MIQSFKENKCWLGSEYFTEDLFWVLHIHYGFHITVGNRNDVKYYSIKVGNKLQEKQHYNAGTTIVRHKDETAADIATVKLGFCHTFKLLDNGSI